MTKSIMALLILSFAVAFDADAQSIDRIAQLESEVRELTARVSKLESMLNKQANTPESATAEDGWKHLPNWRKLSTDMSPADVRRILGEPERLDGGAVARWYYPNGGRLTFISGQLSSWQEPGRR